MPYRRRRNKITSSQSKRIPNNGAAGGYSKLPQLHIDSGGGRDSIEIEAPHEYRAGGRTILI